MVIERITNTSSMNLSEVNKLLSQQSPNSTQVLSEEDIEEALTNENFFFLIAKEGSPNTTRVVGMATIFFQRNLARWIAEIHDVVVDENCRGQGVGETLVRALLDIAQTFSKEHNANVKLYLTSRPSRVAANKLYRKLGFSLVAEATGDWGTNLYKLIVGCPNNNS
jgi:ribosomal protein S18 acetylase RimI-like enzyme